MDDFLSQIDKALEAGLHYVALFAALTIPDICAALEAPNGQASGSRYARWVEDNMARWWGDGDGKLLYSFRSSLLHQGSGRPHEKSSRPRLIFVEPDASVRVHMTFMELGDEKAVAVDLPSFCREVIAAARAWQRKIAGTPNYERNLKRLVRRHAEGLPPFVAGVPVIG